MIVTERDAKDSLCPLTYSAPKGATKCRGSECKMGWRWKTVATVRDSVTLQRVPAGVERKGFCGMFGEALHDE